MDRGHFESELVVILLQKVTEVFVNISITDYMPEHFNNRSDTLQTGMDASDAMLFGTNAIHC
jgi:hypothetical protein